MFVFQAYACMFDCPSRLVERCCYLLLQCCLPVPGMWALVFYCDVVNQVILFFWINKNLLPKRAKPKKRKINYKEPKSHQKKRKSDSTSPKTKQEGQQPETEST